jgi:hypothetical protein
MNIDELIERLIAIRRERGCLTVLAYDGADYAPCKEPVKLVAVEETEFWTGDGHVRRLAVSLLTG